MARAVDALWRISSLNLGRLASSEAAFFVLEDFRLGGARYSAANRPASALPKAATSLASV